LARLLASDISFSWTRDAGKRTFAGRPPEG